MKRLIAFVLAFVMAIGPVGLARAARYSNACCCPPLTCPPPICPTPSVQPSCCEWVVEGCASEVTSQSIPVVPEVTMPATAPTPAIEPTTSIVPTSAPELTPAPEIVEPLPSVTPIPTPQPEPETNFDAPPTTITPPPTASTPTPSAPTTQPETTASPTPAVPEPTPAAPTPETTPPVDDIFGDAIPLTTPAPTPATPAAETTPTQPAPAPAPAAMPADGKAPEAEDLFNSGASLRALDEPGGWSSEQTRLWNDAGGLHTCEARLTGATAREVVLDRADGESVRVPYEALSDADLQFVRRQIDARRAQLAALAQQDLVAAQGR
jgi:hypothetical protein